MLHGTTDQKEIIVVHYYEHPELQYSYYFTMLNLVRNSITT